MDKRKEDAGFLAYQLFIKDLRVANDTAERGIALITRFTRAAKNDSELQWLLQAVEDHRKRVTVMNKSKLETLRSCGRRSCGK